MSPVYGFHYASFASPDITKPFYMNTRVYSNLCILNDLPFRFESKYNEDTDFCLTSLKRGYNTILLNTFLLAIETSATKKGGNEELNKNNRRQFVEELIKRHPERVTMGFRYSKIQHVVNYSDFKKLLELDNTQTLPQTFDNHNLQYEYRPSKTK